MMVINRGLFVTMVSPSEVSVMGTIVSCTVLIVDVYKTVFKTGAIVPCAALTVDVYMVVLKTGAIVPCAALTVDVYMVVLKTGTGEGEAVDTAVVVA
jgi:hypothetical protein